LKSPWHRQQGKPAWMMGVLNCTPDSFSDGSPSFNAEKSINQAKRLLAQGASIIDVGGESTRPGAEPVSLEEELARVIPVITAIKGLCPISIDTTKAEVMSQAIKAGATMINDVSALLHDEKSVVVAADSGVDVCLMHMKGSPKDMQDKPAYDNVVDEVGSFFEQRIQVCLDAGIQMSSILLDPGIGFGKRLEDNLALIANLGVLRSRFNLPILLGASRKSFLGAMTGADVDDREIETAVISGIGIYAGADMIRIHDCLAQIKAAIIGGYCADARQDMIW